MIRSLSRYDWFSWGPIPDAWAQEHADVPGLRFGGVVGAFRVQFHVTHYPLLPSHVQDEVDGLIRECRSEDGDIPRRAPGEHTLRIYQLEDLHRFMGYPSAFLAYEMRLGKTPLACHLHDPRKGPLLVFAPLAARESWRIWVENTLNAALWCCTGRSGENLADLPAYFCHYEILDSHVGFFQQLPAIGTMVLDEVHLLQAAHTKRLQAVSLLRSRVQRALALSGTPMWNKPKSLYTILHLLAPGAWGTQHQFRVRYCNAQPGSHGWTFDGISNADELRDRMMQLMVRRTWADVAAELPPTTRVLEPVGLTAAQYQAIEVAATHTSLAHGTNTLAGYTATLRRKLAHAKIKPAIEIAKQAAKDGHKVVLWTWHNEVADKLAVALVKEGLVLRYSADLPARVRDQQVTLFREACEPTFMVVGMGVGGLGLDLSCSDYAIFVELDYTPANVHQAEMRTFHISRPHVVVYLYTDDPVETKLVEVLNIKNGFAGALGLSAENVLEKIEL